MIDNDIEKALSPDKPDWKEPLWAKFKSYAIGFGAAVLVVALLLSVLYLWKGSEAAIAPQTEPTMTVYPLPQNQAKDQFVKTNKKVTQAVKKSEVKPTVNEMETVGKPIVQPRIDDGFTAEFDRDLSKFETNLKKEFP